MEFDCFKNGFFIPENLILIGTMNDIDKSVESFDFAMRRRFQWIPIDADAVMKDVLLGIFSNVEISNKEAFVIVLCEQIERMNKKLVERAGKYGITKDYKIGPSFFKKYEFPQKYDPSKNNFNTRSLLNIYTLEIMPMIEEYLRGICKEKEMEDIVKACRAELIGSRNT